MADSGNLSEWILYDNGESTYTFRLADIQELEEYHLNADDISYRLYLNFDDTDGENCFPTVLDIGFELYRSLLNRLQPEWFSFLRKCSCGGYPIRFVDSEGTQTQGIACSKSPHEHRVFCRWGARHSRGPLADGWQEQKFGKLAEDEVD